MDWFKGRRLWTILLFASLFIANLGVTIKMSGNHGCNGKRERRRFIQDMVDKIAQRQVQVDSDFIAQVQPRRVQGNYDCHVRFNFAGECWQRDLRHQIAFYDNNAFVPIMVSQLLVEASRFGKAPPPSEKQLQLALSYLEKCLDTTRGFNNSLVGFYPYSYDVYTRRDSMQNEFIPEFNGMMFDLPQVLVDGFSGLLTNSILDLVATRRNPGTLTGCLKEAKEQTVVDEIKNSGFVQMTPYSSRPVFPSDTDDTFCWLSLGSALVNAANGSFSIEQAASRWRSLNSNITSAFDQLKKYAYRPFSENPDENTIDTRSFYVLRDFLWAAKQSKKNVMLPTTWLQHISEETPFISGYQFMPTMVNDVCLVVGANTLHGITSSILSGLVSPTILDDPEIATIYHNTTVLIDYMVRHDYFQRQDLLLFYYPSKAQFYYFLSRTLFELENFRQELDLPHKLMEFVYDTFRKLFMMDITDTLLLESREIALKPTSSCEGKLKEDLNMNYFEEFLGNGDFNANGEELRSGEDRIFSTATASIALMNTWTVFKAQSRVLKWKTETPSSVKRVIQGCIQWLVVNGFGDDENFSMKNIEAQYWHNVEANLKHKNEFNESAQNTTSAFDPTECTCQYNQSWQMSRRPQFKTWNAFFTSGRKGVHNFPFWYPANRFQYINLTTMDGNLEELPKEKFFVAVSGVIEKDEYDRKLLEIHFGRPTPISWPGFNHPGWNSFSFWSSDAYTYATSLLAVSMFHNIDDAH